MKKNKLLIFTRVLYSLFIIGTIVVLWMIYKDVHSSIAFKFGMGYLFLTFFLILYVPIITILNARKLKWVNIRERFFKFIISFITLWALGYAFDWIFRPSKVDLFRGLPIAFGLSFGIYFTDILFLKKNKN
ncbi:hypothetical protein [Clostridium sp. BSD9I1]|uniref:hypothetical protein n=1 Tax=Clostridium sp. BSD9I1 TaxID=2003589 RepID=UPI0016470145|nr:hypothetical protein [Clostridium sp. BSD9I1]